MYYGRISSFLYTHCNQRTQLHHKNKQKNTKNYSKDSKKRSWNDKRETVNEIETSHFDAM